MAYGGGTFLFQNKELSGAYINFVSMQKPLNSVSDRGVGALALELSWGKDGEAFEVTKEDFLKNSVKIFGYDYTRDELKGLRDFFKRAETGWFYKLGTGGTKATNATAEAVCTGERGNALSVAVERLESTEGNRYAVVTYLEGREVDRQEVAEAGDFKANGYITFKAKTLAETASQPLVGGANGTVTGASHQDALNAFEAVAFNTLGCLSSDETVKSLYIEYTKRMREEVGKNFQLVVHNPRTAPDHEGVIVLGCDAVDEKGTALKEITAGVYWVTGASAGCPVNESNENRAYNGEYMFKVPITQNDLKKALRKGHFVFHKINDRYLVAKDINCYTSFTVAKNKDFRLNQVVRVLDQIGNDIAVMFNKYYLGKTPNDSMGRNALYSDINDYIHQLESVRAVQNYDYKNDLKVEAGREKEGVAVALRVEPTTAMAKLYMVVEVR